MHSMIRNEVLRAIPHGATRHHVKWTQARNVGREGAARRAGEGVEAAWASSSDRDVCSHMTS